MTYLKCTISGNVRLYEGTHISFTTSKGNEQWGTLYTVFWLPTTGWLETLKFIPVFF